MLSKKFAAWVLLVFSSCLFAENTSWSIQDPDREGWSDISQAVLYFHHSHPQMLWAEQALSKIEILANDTIADLGCGDGRVSANLSIRYPNAKIIGFDISAMMLKIANLKYPNALFSNLSFQKLNNTEFDIANSNEEFDKVISTMVFHVVPEPESALKNIAKILKPNGQVVLTYISAGDHHFVTAGKKTMKEFGFSMPNSRKHLELEMRFPEQAKQLLEKTGFTVNHIEDKVDRYHFVGRAEFLEWLKGTTAANWSIPKEKQDEFFNRFIDHYIALDGHSLDGDGLSRIVSRIIIVATKKKPHNLDKRVGAQPPKFQ